MFLNSRVVISVMGFLGEKYIKLRGKTKTGFTDKQGLIEMHYYTFNKFKGMADDVGFKVQDLKEYKIHHPELISTQKFQKIAKLLKLFRIGRTSLPIYYLARFFRGGFEFMLKK